MFTLQKLRTAAWRVAEGWESDCWGSEGRRIRGVSLVVTYLGTKGRRQNVWYFILAFFWAPLDKPPRIYAYYERAPARALFAETGPIHTVVRDPPGCHPHHSHTFPRLSPSHPWYTRLCVIYIRLWKLVIPGRDSTMRYCLYNGTTSPRARFSHPELRYCFKNLYYQKCM